jgi:hypothetical protein
MSMYLYRRFGGADLRRIIVSMPVEEVKRIDELIRYRHPARGNRSEFARLAMAEKLVRDTAAGLPPTSKPLRVPIDPAPDRTEMARAASKRMGTALDDRLDEMADLCANWLRNRRSNRAPPSLRSAIIQCVGELQADLEPPLLTRQEQQTPPGAPARGIG